MVVEATSCGCIDDLVCPECLEELLEDAREKAFLEGATSNGAYAYND
jgi:hypothetical protein